MKTLSSSAVWRILLTVSVVAGAFAGVASAQSTIPVVTLVATDPIASVSGDTGTFTLFRSGDTNSTLNVYCRIGGTASNGLDYAQISNFVLIPAGASTNTVTIAPINHGQTNTETVELQLAPSPLMTPVNYSIGNPSNAVVYILGNGQTNLPPLVAITAPADGATFYTPLNIPIVAVAADRDGFVTRVEFFAGATSLGVVSNFVVVDPPGPGALIPGTRAFFLTWSNAPAGKYPLTAVATDDGGVSTVSAPVNIVVLPGPPPTNIPPVVRITSPANGSAFHAPVDIPIYAYADDPDGSVVSVEFFAGTNSLGLGNPIPCATPQIICVNCPPLPPPVCPSNVFVLVWSNAPLGSYALTATATDNSGVSTTSDPVNVTILPTPPPPTNRPPIVSIVATDPVAIEGTNCWVWPGVTNSPPTWTNWPAAVTRLFTNCGPKNAIFTVHRFGDTNDAVTVTYDIGGTATNGVDYVTLPGVVTIPAGERIAMIAVVPLDDGPPDITSTVILKLTPSTNAPPDYVIGFPPRAAAIIIDGNFPRPVATLLPDGCFHLSATGPDGAWFSVEYSNDLINWTPICTNQVVNGAIDFVDPDAPGNQTRFYHAVPLLNPPPE